MMKYRRLGSEGPVVSMIAFGSWITGGENWGPVDEAESLAALECALAEGVTLIDTAPAYGGGRAERCIAKVIRGKRENIVLATKCGLRKEGNRHTLSLRPADIREDLEGSLRRLAVEYIDLYQCHWPDPETPIEETMEALALLQKEEKIRWIGLSNVNPEVLERALRVASVVSVQEHYSPVERTLERAMLPCCRCRGVGVMTYGSLAGGILSGKYSELPHLRKGDARSFFYRYYREPEWSRIKTVVACLRDIGLARGKPASQVALNWILAQPGISTALVGMRNAAQVVINTGTSEGELADGEYRAISAAADILEQERAKEGE